MKRRPVPATEPYPYRDFQEALKRLKAAMMQNHGYALLLGESGTGKTTLLRALSAALDRPRFQVLYLSHVQASPKGLARVLATALHLPLWRTGVETSQALVQTLRDAHTRLVFFIDEAQLMGDDALQELRLLAEADLGGTPLFSVVFSAMPDFRERLGATKLFALWRRISPRLTLTGLVRDEVVPFLAHVLGKDAATRFSAEAIGTIFEQARGLPAQVHSFATQALRSHSQGTIAPEMVTRAIDGLDPS